MASKCRASSYLPENKRINIESGGAFIAGLRKRSGPRAWQDWPEDGAAACIKVHYDGVIVGDFVADLLVEERVIVELKAVRAIDDIHVAQALNYLKATRLPTCLLINFGKSGVELRRFGLDRTQDTPAPGPMAPEDCAPQQDTSP